MRRLFATVGAFGLAAGGVFGGPGPKVGRSAPAPSPPVAGSPAELVARLGADDFRTREAAVTALERSGAAAIPALRAAMASDDPEVRLRAVTILYKLQRAVDSAAKLAPAKIALNYKDTPLGAAVNDLQDLHRAATSPSTPTASPTRCAR